MKQKTNIKKNTTIQDQNSNNWKLLVGIKQIKNFHVFHVFFYVFDHISLLQAVRNIFLMSLGFFSCTVWYFSFTKTYCSSFLLTVDECV